VNALKLATQVKKIIAKHIQGKGYEVEASLLTPSSTTLNRDQSSLTDEGNPSDQPHEELIKIVVTAHEEDENTTNLGDNPNVVLDFISIENGDEPDVRRVEEGRILVYLGKRYVVNLVAPATLAGQLIIKECRARSVK
jgi:hypothetical protein